MLTRLRSNKEYNSSRVKERSRRLKKNPIVSVPARGDERKEERKPRRRRKANALFDSSIPGSVHILFFFPFCSTTALRPWLRFGKTPWRSKISGGLAGAAAVVSCPLISRLLPRMPAVRSPSTGRKPAGRPARWSHARRQKGKATNGTACDRARTAHGSRALR